MRNEQPDHVPAVPDLWQMIPIRLSGRPSWEILVHQDPPLWKARMDAHRFFGVDALFAIPVPMSEPRVTIVHESEEQMIARDFTLDDGERNWSPYAIVYRRHEPSARVRAATIGLPDSHEDFRVITPNYAAYGKDYLDDARAFVGNDGVVAPMISLPSLPLWEEEILRYYDEREAVRKEMQNRGQHMMRQLETILSWGPDAVMIGNSGLMISNPPEIFQELGLEWLKSATALTKKHGVPSFVHCCGPERALVEIAATETDLDCIEPLEPPPMGDCNLHEIKRSFGDRLALKGNLHTTEVMLRGTAAEVEDACKAAIDAAAAGGGFILSTGDQTPRDTPDETIRIMQRVAETYGRY